MQRDFQSLTLLWNFFGKSRERCLVLKDSGIPVISRAGFGEDHALDKIRISFECAFPRALSLGRTTRCLRSVDPYNRSKSFSGFPRFFGGYRKMSTIPQLLALVQDHPELDPDAPDFMSKVVKLQAEFAMKYPFEVSAQTASHASMLATSAGIDIAKAAEYYGLTAAQLPVMLVKAALMGEMKLADYLQMLVTTVEEDPDGPDILLQA